MNRKNFLIIILLAGIMVMPLFTATKLLRFPDVSKDKIAFVYGGDIWIVKKDGGIAKRLTSFPGKEFFPKFSPDGKWIAFVGEIDGNQQIYLISSEGGEPKRLTYLPQAEPSSERMGPDKIVMGWTPDGKKILIRSRHETWDPFVGKLYLVDVKTGYTEPLPLPEGGFATFTNTRDEIVYNRTFRDFRPWKHYRGGMQQDIWVYNFKTHKLKKLTKYEGNDHIPMWYDGKIYFVSERSWKENLFSVDPKTGKVEQLTFFKEYDVKFPSIGDGEIVFENGGYIYLYNIDKKSLKKLTIYVPSENYEVRETYVKLKKYIQGYDISPTGKRVLFEARGEIITVPVKEGVSKNITKSQGVREMDAVYSPDKKWIAYLSDRTGEYEIYLKRADGKGKEIQITKGANCYRWGLRWSPDSKKIAFADKTHRLYYVDINTKKITLVDYSKYNEFRDYSWSPDSKWIAYTKSKKRNLSQIYLYSLLEKKSYEITDRFYLSYNPVFSVDGKYLFFLSDRDFKPTLGNFELNYVYKNMTRPYLIILKKDGKNPFSIKDDEEDVKEEKSKPEGKKNKKSKKEGLTVKIDLAHIKERIVPFPNVSSGEYYALSSIEGGVLYIDGEKRALIKYSIKDKKAKTFANGIFSYMLSSDKKHALLKKGKDFYVVSISGSKADFSKGKINIDNVYVKVDKRKEYQQMFDETWRLFRDYFYNPKMNGMDWKKVYSMYKPLVKYAVTRDDLTYILSEMASELNNSHAYVGGGEHPEIKRTSIGLLGAILEPDMKSLRWKIKKIYEGKNWEKKYISPLMKPESRAYEGEYIISINGYDVKFPDSPYKYLENSAGKPVLIELSKDPSGKNSREIIVKPIAHENKLVYYNWVLEKRRMVDRLSNGKIGYVHIPDMSLEGLSEFVKQYYPQLDKEAMIIDVRGNGGGFVASMIIERLRRALGGLFAPREGAPEPDPFAVFTGPMACLMDRYSASNGDMFPYFFRKFGLGPLIGERTWGGVVGIRGGLPLSDGGYVYKPEFAFYSEDGKWIIEGHGVEPDIHVDNDPWSVMQGKDPQLERAVQYLLEQIKKGKKNEFAPIPEYPDKNYGKKK